LPRFQKTPIYCLKQKKMKKLVLFFAVVLAVSFASCGNKKAAPAEEAPAVEQAAPAASDSAATAATASDSAATSEAAAPAAK
jgi:hypothetical protein